MSDVKVIPHNVNEIYISEGEKQFSGFRTANDSALLVNTSTLKHVKEFHNKFSKFAEEQVKDLIDPSQPL